MRPEDWLNPFFPLRVKKTLSQRWPVLDVPLSIDKVILSVRFNRLNFKKACLWVKDKPRIDLKKTKHTFRFIIHGELLFQFFEIDKALRAIVQDMWMAGLFWFLPEDAPFTEEIDPCEYLFTFVTISEIEIAFDFRENQIPPELFNQDYTLYSDDHHHKHYVFYAYNRIKSLLAKNQEPHQIVEHLKYSFRAEFQLNSRYCPYLNLKTLQGNVYDIAMRFLPYLANQLTLYGPQGFRVHEYDDSFLSQSIHQLLFEYLWPMERLNLLIRTCNWASQVREGLLFARQYGTTESA